MRLLKPKRGGRLADKAPTSKQLLEMAEIKIAERQARPVLPIAPPLPNPFDEAVAEKETA